MSKFATVKLVMLWLWAVTIIYRMDGIVTTVVEVAKVVDLNNASQIKNIVPKLGNVLDYSHYKLCNFYSL